MPAIPNRHRGSRVNDLGLLAGLGEFVPLLGPIASAIPALPVASSLGLGTTLYGLGLYGLAQQIESNVVTLLVARKLISIPPPLTLFAIVAMALAFGALGLLPASPLTVVLFVLVRKLYVQVDGETGRRGSRGFAIQRSRW
ncbi:AI-2E family transporter [Azospirillum himalayense]|uniref:AI-2E family transporter n=1 Tax=Azospirillum himalayense TaxID=654847 RepID=A0ABW0G717_9PROT